MGSPEGARKAVAIRMSKYSEEQRKEWQIKGGSAKVPKGFAVTGKAKSAGRLSGHVRRMKKRQGLK